MAAYIEMHIRCHLTLKEIAVYIEGHVRWQLTKMGSMSFRRTKTPPRLLYLLKQCQKVKAEE